MNYKHFLLVGCLACTALGANSEFEVSVHIDRNQEFNSTLSIPADGGLAFKRSDNLSISARIIGEDADKIILEFSVKEDDKLVAQSIITMQRGGEAKLRIGEKKAVLSMGDNDDHEEKSLLIRIKHLEN